MITRRRIVITLTGVATLLLLLPSLALAAPWADDPKVTSATFKTAALVAPSVSCPAVLGLGSLTFDWSDVPGATKYLVRYGVGGGKDGTSDTSDFTVGSLLGTGSFSVQAQFGPSTWVSPASPARSYTVALGLLSTCA